MIKNPFPGPQPYRSSDRKLFFGRDELARKLEAVIMATRCMTVHGPSGAGKSSLVQAAVLPRLVESRDVRVVRVDAWPANEKPDSWLAQAIYSALRLGNLSENQNATEAILHGARRAARASDRLVVIYLDQLEQLFFAGRSSGETEEFFDCLQQLVEIPARSLRVVLSLREDYLGRFRDRVRDRGRLLENTFRVGPLTVQELTEAVCQAARAGEPPQEWSPEIMRTLMLQVRVPGQTPADDAEAQAAYAQIVCRALFQERSEGKKKINAEIEAEPILRRYFDTTLSNLGKLSDPAQRLLEDHLVSADGSRTLRTEKELLRILPEKDLFPILKALEQAAILHASEHQGSRYFEIGHDWLARKVFEERKEREAQEAARKHEEEMQRQFEEKERIAAERLEHERKRRRRFALFSGGALAFAVITMALGLYAWRAQRAAEAARREATRAQLDAVRKRIQVNDQKLLLGFTTLMDQGHPSFAIKLLPEVKYPASVEGWLSIASDALSENRLRVTLSGHSGPIVAARFSPDGERLLTASADGTARIWKSNGDGNPIILSGHNDAILSAAWSPDGKHILTTSGDGTARIWNSTGQGDPVRINAGKGPIWSGNFAPDNQRVALGTDDGALVVAATDGSGEQKLIASEKNPSGFRFVTFFPDNQRVLAALENGGVHLWSLDSQDKPLEIGKHEERVESMAVSPDATKVLTAAGESFAKLFVSQGKTWDKPILLSCGDGRAIKSALSPDGSLAAISCANYRVHLFSTSDKSTPLVLEGPTAFISDLAFRPDGKFLAVASHDSVARVYSVAGGSPRLELHGHIGAIGVLSFSADGKRLVTGASDERSKDFTAKIWNVSVLDELPAPPRNQLPRHAIAIRRDGRYVAAAFDDNVVRVRHADGSGSRVELKGHHGWVAHVAWSPEGDRIVTASFDMTARVWRADGTGNAIELGGDKLDGHKAGLRHAAFSADGEFVATASEDKTAKVWHANHADKPIATLAGHEDWVTSVVFSPDGKKIATSSQDYMVRVFSLDKPNTPIVFGGHEGPVNSVAFSPDGQFVASAGDDGTVRIFSVNEQRPAITLKGDTANSLRFAVWSSDGKRIAAASSNHLVYIWDADGLTEPNVLAPQQKVIALVFQEHDHELLAVLEDGSTRPWRIDIQELVQALRNANGDCLPPPIREKFLEETKECATNGYELCESEHGRRAAPAVLTSCNQPSITDELAKLTATVNADAVHDDGIFHFPLNPPENHPTLPTAPTNSTNPIKSLKDIGPDGCHVRVVVLPGDAVVMVDGSPKDRKDGAIELFGKRGDVVRLRASKGGQFVEVEVKIEEFGAVPPVVVLPMRDVAPTPPL